MEYILETNSLDKKYNGFKALSNLNIHVPKNSIYGLIGQNGAGKTTLIRVICGLQKPSSGEYAIYGIKNTTSEILNVRKRISAIIESPSIYGGMTAKENLIHQFKTIGIPNLDGVDELLKLVGLDKAGGKKATNFSLGMKQRLGIAMALSTNPDFLILDEPINGLDPEGIIEMRELILKLNIKKKITVLISSHYLDELAKIATQYGFVHKGTIIKEISAAELNKELENKIELKVANPSKFVRFFEENNISYEIIDESSINIYGKLNLPDVITKLSKKNLEVIDAHEKGETLESYYMNLIGGCESD